MQEHLVQFGNVKLWTISQGQGLPVMLCNGGPGYCDYLGPVAEMMHDLVQVYRWEQLECGRSAAVPSYDHATCLTDLEALREYFGLDRWIIGGHSWGANLALDYATNYPHRILALIYLAGTGITEDWRPAFQHKYRSEAEGCSLRLTFIPLTTRWMLRAYLLTRGVRICCTSPLRVKQAFAAHSDRN